MDTVPSLSNADRPSVLCNDACCTAEPAVASVPFNAGRAELIRRAFRLEYATVAWMVIEAAVAIWSGVQAASVCLAGLRDRQRD